MEPIRVLIADDHALVRGGIRALVEKIEGILVVGEAGKGREALDLVHELKPDLMLLDLTMPDGGGFEVLEHVKKHFPEILVIVLTVHEAGEYATRALREGAAGFLPKSSASTELEQAIQTVLGGEIYISPEMLKHVPAGIHTRAGSMTALPFEDAWFDAAYATESLEHAVEIDVAVAEICRVVKPGGRIAIIDKNAAHFGKLKTPQWERWFDRKELERLLRRSCRDVHSQFISYWEDVEPDGMFLAWLAIR